MNYYILILESTSFAGRRINKTTNAYDINYFITDHLGSTRVIVDNSGTIKAQYNYYPFGKQWEDINLMANTNRYTFSGKEKQTVKDLGYLDFIARMYANSEIPMFTTQDPLAEKYYSVSPYAYCANNPVNRTDPNGMDIWEVNKQGQVKWIEESKTHVLYALDDKGKRTDNSINVTDRNILDQLTKSKEMKMTYSDGYVEKVDSREARTDKNGADEMISIFMFMADNTNVEWNFSHAKVDGEEKYGIRTLGYSEETRSPFKGNDLITSLHSHPDIPNNVKEEQSSMRIDRGNSNSRNYNQYVYFPISTRLYNVKNGKSAYVRHINRNPKRFINIK
jgi:RHS repeat-associated protein